jgi:hypothetical protein
MLYNVTTVKGLRRFYRCDGDTRRNIRNQLLNQYAGIVRCDDDPNGMRRYMPPEEYLKFRDRVEEENEDG